MSMLAGPSSDHDNIVDDLLAWAKEVSDNQPQESALPDDTSPDDVPGGEIVIANRHKEIDYGK